jgi:hypothetical protein
VLTLTIAGPVRTYFAQRTEMAQLAASEAALRRQIADLEQQKGKLGDPAYVAAQARERLGFCDAGGDPVSRSSCRRTRRLPPRSREAVPTANAAANDPWYTSLWHTIADQPHLPPASAATPPAEPGPAGPVPPASVDPSAPGG